jgi:DNA-binding NtrC family response regulator
MSLLTRVEAMSTVLLVDDDPLQAFVRKSLLEKRFHDVRRVADTAEAFCLVEQPQFAGTLGLVIADLHMPGPLAVGDFVAEMHARLPGVPVLVLDGVKETPANCATEGVRFLSKPSGSDEILSAASQLMSHESETHKLQ